DSIRMDVSQMKIDIDETGKTAVAEFDKAWVFEGESVSEGKVRSQLKLMKSGDRWLITAEKDLRVYNE
ncbi:MAG: hypothetical protein LC730_02630, partial [Acidobacteria bacterium]|nr:hypothetical protein [Acidobacteriota bacterium]